jgi:hypothetical protein
VVWFFPKVFTGGKNMEEKSILAMAGKPHEVARQRFLQIAGEDAALVSAVEKMTRPMDTLTSFIHFERRRRFWTWFVSEQHMLRSFVHQIEKQRRTEVRT